MWTLHCSSVISSYIERKIKKGRKRRIKEENKEKKGNMLLGKIKPSL